MKGMITEMSQFIFRAVSEDGRGFFFDEKRRGGHIFLTLPKERLAGVSRLRILPDLSFARAGEDGFYILPRNIGHRADLLVRFEEREDVTYTYDKPVLSFYGLKTSAFCGLVRIERNYKIAYEVTVRDGRYTVTPLFDFTKHDPVYDDIRIELVPLAADAGLSEMAAAERNLRLERGEITTLREKCGREAVEYARKYPSIRIRMGWKPSPSPVFHQTVETEPDMFVACTFDRVCDIAYGLKRAGVEGAELQLVGWNIRGHDGRFPQIFPADPALGGDAGLRHCIETVKSLGYRISLHTNLIDEYEIADTFTWDDIAVKRNGNYNQTGHYSGGYAYHVCLHKQLKNCLRDFPAVAALGLNGIHFNDVISIVEPDDCHAPDHPCSTGEGVRVAQAIMAWMRDRFGAFSSEGAMDFAVPYLDYALYLTFGDGFGHNAVPVCSEFVPFYEMIYHGIVLYNPSSPTVNAAIKSPADLLTMTMRGGKPTFYFYSKFRTGAKNWMGDVDLTCDTDEELERSCRVIADTLRDYAPLADRQFLFMTDYEFLPGGIQVATYSDGKRIVGNFSDTAADFEGHALAPYAYALI